MGYYTHDTHELRLILLVRHLTWGTYREHFTQQHHPPSIPRPKSLEPQEPQHLLPASILEPLTSSLYTGRLGPSATHLHRLQTWPSVPLRRPINMSLPPPGTQAPSPHPRPAAPPPSPSLPPFPPLPGTYRGALVTQSTIARCTFSMTLRAVGRAPLTPTCWGGGHFLSAGVRGLSAAPSACAAAETSSERRANCGAKSTARGSSLHW
jgi:hypothetical protein